MANNPGPSAPLVNVGVFPTEGIDFSQIYVVNVNSSGGASYAPEFPLPPFKVGQRAFGSNGTEYVFCQVGANNSLAANTVAAANVSSIVPWAAVQIDPNGFFVTPLNTTGFVNKWQFGVNASGNTAVLTNTSTIATYLWVATRGANLAVLANNTSTNSAYAQHYGQYAATSAGRITALIAGSSSYVVTGFVFTQSANTGSLSLGGSPVQFYATWPRLSVSAATNTAVPE